MITRLRIRTFKSLEDVDIELARVNVFVGANGAGKSNLLEALGVLGTAAGGRVDDEALQRRGVRPGVPRLYKSAFPRKEKIPDIFFEADSENASYSVRLNNPLDDPLPAWRYSTEAWFGGSNPLVNRSRFSKPQPNAEQGLAALTAVKLQPDDAALDLFDRLRNYCIYAPNTPTLRGLIQDFQQREPIGLSGGRLSEALLELLKARKDQPDLGPLIEETLPLIDWANDWGSELASNVPLSPSVARTTRVVRFYDRFMRKGSNKLTGYDASEGALYVLFAAVLALHPKAPRTFAIDNADATLNPRLARRLAECFCRWILGFEDRQVLLTAHNPSVLDGLPLQDHRIRLFTVGRDNRGRTTVRQVVLTENLLAKAAEGWTLSRMWVAGDLGGVPNV